MLEDERKTRAARSQSVKPLSNKPPLPALVSARAAASSLGLPYTTLRDVAFRGEIPVLKIGRAWYFRCADLTQWVNSRAEVMQ